MTLGNSNPPSIAITLSTSNLLNDLTVLWCDGLLTLDEYDRLTMMLMLDASVPVHQLSSIQKLSYMLARVF